MMTESVISTLMKMLADKEYKEYYIYITILDMMMRMEDNLQD